MRVPPGIMEGRLLFASEARLPVSVTVCVVKIRRKFHFGC